MSHEDRSYESTQQPSYHVHSVHGRQPAQAPAPTTLAPPQPVSIPSSSPPGPHDPSTPLPESMNTMPRFIAQQLGMADPESHQFDDAEESMGAAGPSRAEAGNNSQGAELNGGEKGVARARRPSWQTAPISSPDQFIPTSSADPVVASERDEIDDSLVIEDSQLDQIDIPSPQDSSSSSPPPTRTPRKAPRVGGDSTHTTPNRTPLSKLQPPLPPSRSLGKAVSNIIAAPPQPRLEFVPPPKRGKTITPQKLPTSESEDSFAGGLAPKVAPLKRLNQIFDRSEVLPIPPEMVSTSQLDRDAMEEDEEGSPAARNGLPPPFRAVSPVSPSPPKRHVILPPSSDEPPAPPIGTTNGIDGAVEMPSVSSRSTGFVIPPRRFAVPSQEESEDTSPSKKSHLFSSQSTNNALFASESQFSYTFQATQFNTIPQSSPPPNVHSDGSANRESSGTDASRTSGPSAPEEATQIVSDLSQQRTAEYVGPIYPNVHSPAVAIHSPVVTSPAVAHIQPNRRLGRRPLGLDERPNVSLPTERLLSAVSEGQPSPATVAAPEMPELENHQQNPVDSSPRAVEPEKPLNTRGSLTPPPSAAAHVSPLPGSSPDVPMQPLPDVPVPTGKSKTKRGHPASSPPGTDSEQDQPIRRPSKRTRRPPTRFTPEPEPEPEPQAETEVIAAAPVQLDVEMDASEEPSDEDEPVRKPINKSKARARIPESQPDEPNGQKKDVHLRNNDETSEDELSKPIKRAKGRRIPITPSTAEVARESEPSEPATPPDPENSDYESFHPTKKALLAKKQQMASGPRGQKRKSDISTAASSKSKAPAAKARRMTRSSVDSSVRLTTPSSVQSGPTKDIRVMAHWNGTPAGWYLGHVVGVVGEHYRIRFEDKTEAVVPLRDIRRCELRKGESVWASGPKALKKKGELIVAEDWGMEDAAYRAGPRVTNKNGQSAGHILPKNVFIHRTQPPQEFEDRVVEASDLEDSGDAETAAAGPSSAIVPHAAPSTRANSPMKGSKEHALAGKTFLVTAAADFSHTEVTNTIRAHGGTVGSNWEDLFNIPTNRFGSTLRTPAPTPFVIYVGTPLQMNPKFMVALAKGIPCLSSDYIEAVANGDDVDWRSYLLSSGQSTVMNQWCSQMVDPTWGEEGWKMGDAQNARQPYTGKTVLFLEPKNENLKHLVPFCVSALGGAQFNMAKSVTSQNAIGVDYIIVETRDKNWKSAVGKALQDDERLCCIQWLKECLIMGAALTPILKYD